MTSISCKKLMLNKSTEIGEVQVEDKYLIYTNDAQAFKKQMKYLFIINEELESWKKNLL